jgi:hypothetical protein
MNSCTNKPYTVYNDIIIRVRFNIYCSNTGTELLVSFADGKIALLSIGNPDQTILVNYTV